MLEAGQAEKLERRKRRHLKFLAIGLIAMTVVCALRFVPRWNDRLAGRPQYAKAMTTIMAQEFAKAAQDPVILQGEDDHCEALKPTGITDDQIAGLLYLFTYSEQKHFSCITICAVPVDATKFADLRTIRPDAEWTSGPRLIRPVQVLPVTRSLHVHSPQYLQLLHWRAPARFPLSESQAAGMVPQHKESVSDPSVQPEGQANIAVDFDKARALVRKPHDKVNFWLSLVLGLLGTFPLCFVLSLVGLYKNASRYLRLYEQELPVVSFLRQNLNVVVGNARSRYFERQRKTAAQHRKEEVLRSLRHQMEEGLRSALVNVHDEILRQKIEDCLSAQPHDLDRMKQLWSELQETLGHKTPEERLAMLLESLKPYCTEEEFNACRAEALAILAQSGFKPARKFAVAMHDQYRLRAREMEDMEDMEEDSRLADDDS